VGVDIDPRHGGFDSWHDLIDLHGPIDTLESLTGTEGEHIFFKAPIEKLGNSAGAIGRGIDTRAEGDLSSCRPLSTLRLVNDMSGSLDNPPQKSPTGF
jgi:hypothetical protein